jgi:hypothetical protein
MPYITNDKRHQFRATEIPSDPGELNYYITLLAKKYLQQQGLTYKTINDIMGALESAKLEFYRRVAEPYENMKCSLNGDVYDER